MRCSGCPQAMHPAVPVSTIAFLVAACASTQHHEIIITFNLMSSRWIWSGIGASGR